MDNSSHSPPYPYDTSYGYPHVPPPLDHPYPPPNSGPYPPHPYPPPYHSVSHSGPLTYQYPPPPPLPPATIHSGPLEYGYPPPSHSGPLPYPYHGYQVPPVTYSPPQPSLHHHTSFQYGSSHYDYQHSGPLPSTEGHSSVPSQVNSLSSLHRQDSSASVGPGSRMNHGDISDSTSNYPSAYPPIDDLLSNVHLSNNHPSAPEMPSVPPAPPVYSSSPKYQSAKYNNQNTLYGYSSNSFSSSSGASYLSPTGSSPRPALSHSTSLTDSPPSQSLQIVPSSNSKGSLKVLLLHGNLDIWVHEGKNLPNMDMFHKTLTDMFNKLPGSLNTKIEGHVSSKITSDPCVSISVTGAVIGRTYVISNSENPVWEQRFYLPVAHHAAEVHFLVKDSDVVGSELIGVVTIPVEHLYSGEKIEGVFPILNNNGKPCKPGAVLSLSIQYTPIERLSNYYHGVEAGPDYYGVPCTNFPLRRGGRVTLYQDAHVPDGCLPNFNLDNGMQYAHGKCWHDIFDELTQLARPGV